MVNRVAAAPTQAPQHQQTEHLDEILVMQRWAGSAHLHGILRTLGGALAMQLLGRDPGGLWRGDRRRGQGLGMRQVEPMQLGDA